VTNGVRSGQGGAQLRGAVLTAGAELFDRAGYHNTTIGSIAERAGTTRAAVYEIFTAKHDILHAIHDEWIDVLLELGRTHIRPGDPVCDSLRQCFHDIFAVVHERPSQVRVYFEYFRDLPPDLQKLARAKRDMYEAQVEGIIRRGIETGVFRPQNARVAALGLFGMCNWSYQWYRPGGPLTAGQIAAQLSDIYLRGMTVDPAEAAAEG
jgi:AcrR family transcriptional regulator